MTRLFFLIVGFFFLVTGFPAQATAQSSFAVVDVQALMLQSEAAKSIEKQLESHKGKFLHEIGAQEKELRETEKTLSEQKEKMTKEEFVKKAREFEEKLMETRRQAQVKKKNIDEASAKALGELRSAMTEVVSKIAADKGFTMVLAKQNVVFSDPSMDITDEAMTQLNKKVSNIKLAVSGQ